MSALVDDPNIRGNSVLGIALRVVLVSLVAIVGWNIMLPGLDPAFMATQLSAGDSSRLSVLALGAGPVLTALALGQIVRLVAPRLDNSSTLVGVENVIALLVALSQADGIARSFSAMGFLADDSTFTHVAIVASLVGGVAVLLFLSRQVALPSLVAGFWIVWLLPALIGLPAQLSNSFEFLRTGAVDGKQLMLVLLLIVIGAALSLFATRAVMNIGKQQESVTRAKHNVPLLNVVIWPPLLAAIAGGYILTPIAYLAPYFVSHSFSMNIYMFGIVPVLILIFAIGYRRFFSSAGVTFPLSVALLVAATQIALLLGGEVAIGQMLLPLPLNGTTLLVLVAVVSALVDAIRRPSTPSS
ncbi:hypothetical protein [Agrobacterium sp. lyk4-40-TYG-31]|uniref:hypothetical protein n=1 Tax=Agrobacterium sp. lyk4-40-TYG-31 TaxID=3040276 RepID=UPI0025518D77|nr:hypothetical protein [Agrobacterium sp. lyk4-40-TYG-31]